MIYVVSWVGRLTVKGSKSDDISLLVNTMDVTCDFVAGPLVGLAEYCFHPGGRETEIRRLESLGVAETLFGWYLHLEIQVAGVCIG